MSQNPLPPTREELNEIHGAHGDVLQMEKYDVVINHTKKARENKLLKFTDKKGKKLVEIGVEDLIPIIIENFTVEHMYALSADVKQVDMVEVERVIEGMCEKDFSKGDNISFTYRHMMPIEFAVAERALQISDITGRETTPVTKEELDEAAKSISTGIQDFTEQAYASFLRQRKEEDSSTPEGIEGEVVDVEVEVESRD